MLGVNFILAPAQKKSVRNASARGLAMKATFINNLSTQTNDVLYNPQNPVNPDSKPGVRGEFYICTGQKKVDAFTHRREAWQ